MVVYQLPAFARQKREKIRFSPSAGKIAILFSDCNDTVSLQPEKVMINFSPPAMTIDLHHCFFPSFLSPSIISDQSAAGTAPPVDCLRPFSSDSCLLFQRYDCGNTALSQSNLTPKQPKHTSPLPDRYIRRRIRFSSRLLLANFRFG
jgi:hypothetical protein